MLQVGHGSASAKDHMLGTGGVEEPVKFRVGVECYHGRGYAPYFCSCLPPCLAVYNKYAELPGCCVFSVREPQSTGSQLFSVSFLHLLAASVNSIPGVVQTHVEGATP